MMGSTLLGAAYIRKIKGSEVVSDFILSQMVLSCGEISKSILH